MKLPYRFAAMGTDLTSFGLIVLASDESVEPELGALLQTEAQHLYHARIPSAAEVSVESLKQMAAHLPDTAALLPQGLDVIGYACTSGATMIGREQVASLIHQAHPNVPVTSPLDAVLAALAHLKCQRIGFISPYVAQVSAALRQCFVDRGHEISRFGSFEEPCERSVARISPESIFAAAQTVGAFDDVDVVFASCTNLASFTVIDKIESTLGKPFLSSNQALAWHMQKLAGQTPYGPGRLFRT